MDRFKNTTGFKITLGIPRTPEVTRKKRKKSGLVFEGKSKEHQKKKRFVDITTLISSPIKVFGCADPHETVCICQLGENSHLIAVLKLHSYCHLLIFLFPRSVCFSE